MKILIIADVLSDNLGDRAIYQTLKYLFEMKGHDVTGMDLGRQARIGGGRTEPAKSIYLEQDKFEYVKKENVHHPIKAILVFLVSVLPNFAHRWITYYLKGRDFRRRKGEWAKRISANDLIVFGGGALLRDNNWGFPLSLLHVSKLVREIGKQYGCVGCSTGDKFSAMGAKWLRDFLDGCSFIALRDEVSAANLKKLGPYHCRIFIDSAIRINELVKQSDSSEKDALGINILPYVRHPGVTKKNYKNYIGSIEKLIEQLDKSPELGFRSVLLFNTGESGDSYASQQLYLKLNPRIRNLNLKVCRKLESLDELSEVIAQCRTVISSRMHSAIIAKSYRVPIFGVSWDKKIAGFYELIGLHDFYVDYGKCSVEWLLEALKMVFVEDGKQNGNITYYSEELNELTDYVLSAVGGVAVPEMLLQKQS